MNFWKKLFRVKESRGADIAVGEGQSAQQSATSNPQHSASRAKPAPPPQPTLSKGRQVAATPGQSAFLVETAIARDLERNKTATKSLSASDAAVLDEKLFAAIKEWNIDEVKALLAAGANANARKNP